MMSMVHYFARRGQIVVENGVDEPLPTVWVYDAIGRPLEAKREETGYTVSIAVPASGIYLVKIGDWPARRVVVMR